MYSVPPDLDLSRLVGAELITIGIGRFNTSFSFQLEAFDTVGINALGRWEALAPDGEVIGGRARGGSEDYEDSIRLNALLGARVELAHVLTARSIELQVDNGVVLRFFDDSDQFESFTIHGIAESDVIV